MLVYPCLGLQLISGMLIFLVPETNDFNVKGYFSFLIASSYSKGKANKLCASLVMLILCVNIMFVYKYDWHLDFRRKVNYMFNGPCHALSCHYCGVHALSCRVHDFSQLSCFVAIVFMSCYYVIPEIANPSSSVFPVWSSADAEAGPTNMLMFKMQTNEEMSSPTWPLVSKTRHLSPSRLIRLKPASAFCKIEKVKSIRVGE